jgi:hypothetical protein
MLALASNKGFEAMAADELYYINGGSSISLLGIQLNFIQSDFMKKPTPSFIDNIPIIIYTDRTTI